MNVAIIQAVDAFFIVADLKILSSQLSVIEALKAGKDLDQEGKKQDLEVLKAGQKSLQEILDYYKQEGCFYYKDINSLS